MNVKNVILCIPCEFLTTKSTIHIHNFGEHGFKPTGTTLNLKIFSMYCVDKNWNKENVECDVSDTL